MDHIELLDKLFDENTDPADYVFEVAEVITNLVGNLEYMKNRTLEFDKLHTEILKITGFSVEQLKDMFLKGYTLNSPEEPPKLSAIGDLIERVKAAEERAEKSEIEIKRLRDIMLEKGSYHFRMKIIKKKQNRN